MLLQNPIPPNVEMAHNTRYQPAPQRDSLDDGNYSQPPPSYQAEDPINAALLGGVPRGEDDNVPDDFKVLEFDERFLHTVEQYLDAGAVCSNSVKRLDISARGSR